MIKIFIVEDQYLMRRSLEVLLNSQQDMEVVGTAGNGEEALDKIDINETDIVLMDIRMPIMNGITCTKELKRKYPQLNVLILTTFNEEEYIYEALVYNANGYILKNAENEVLMKAVRDTAKGQFNMPVEVAKKLSYRLSQLYDHTVFSIKFDKIFSVLENEGIVFTESEKEIISHIMNRLNNREIAEALYIAEGTLKNYLTIIYSKIGVHNRKSLMEYFKQMNNCV